MQKEDYMLEYTSFCQFREIICDGKTVGFLTLDTFQKSDESLCLNECHILPDYRGKNLLINIINELLEDENISFYIRKPNYSFMKFLLKHELAYEFAPNLVLSSIKLIVKAGEAYSNKFIKRLYKKFSDKDFVYLSSVYHMDFCSVLFIDNSNIIGRRDGTLVAVLPRKEDLKKHSSHKKLNKLTVKGIEKIKHDFEFNQENITESNDDMLALQKDGEIPDKPDLKSDDSFKIQKAVMREENLANLTNKSSELRVRYLSNHLDKIDKTVDLTQVAQKRKTSHNLSVL